MGERRTLRAHLRACPECHSLAQSQRAQRRALKSLVLVPLPLRSRTGRTAERVGCDRRGRPCRGRRNDRRGRDSSVVLGGAASRRRSRRSSLRASSSAAGRTRACAPPGPPGRQCRSAGSARETDARRIDRGFGRMPVAVRRTSRHSSRRCRATKRRHRTGLAARHVVRELRRRRRSRPARRRMRPVRILGGCHVIEQRGTDRRLEHRERRESAGAVEPAGSREFAGSRPLAGGVPLERGARAGVESTEAPPTASPGNSANAPGHATRRRATPATLPGTPTRRPATPETPRHAVCRTPTPRATRTRPELRQCARPFDRPGTPATHPATPTRPGTPATPQVTPTTRSRRRPRRLRRRATTATAATARTASSSRGLR